MELLEGMTINVHDHGFVRYIDHMGTDVDIVEAARVSYASGSKGEEADKKLLAYLFRNKHTSPFEMVKVKFNIKMPIFVMRQFIRHRMQNVNEVSARYTELKDEFFIPEVWRKQDTKNKQGSYPEPQNSEEEQIRQHWLREHVKETYEAAYKSYQILLANGVAREQARIVLPVGIYTEFYSCWDLNNLLKYFALRDDPHAQGEHQDYAKAMKEITRLCFPWVMEIYDIERGLAPRLRQ
jgi:thymidylate synthase (FAD)